jgi:tetraacyldisaccharide 4'-kinase
MPNRWLLLGQKLIERGAWFFAPVSWIWASVVFLKNIAYDRKWLKAHRVPATVVSVGNLVAGGTGKTPFVERIAKSFPDRKIAIVSRAYGKIADEALLLKKRLPNARIYVGKDKTELAKKAAADGAELILIDDGFQHRKLARDVEIVLLRGEDPYGKGQYLPWGFLRDSPKRLQVADAVFVSDRDFRYVPVRILDQKLDTVPSIQGWRVALFCGIANPKSFKKTVEGLRAEVVAEWILADHEAPSLKDLEIFAEYCKALNVKALITTEKDFVKEPKASLPILFVEIEIEWIRRESWEKLIVKIAQKIDNGSAYDRVNKN